MEHIIQNFDKLAEDDLRRDALGIAEAGYEAINVGNALRRTLKIENNELAVLTPSSKGSARSHLADRRVFFVGVGKCAFAAAPIIEELFGEHLTDGIALDVSEPPPGLKKIKTLVGTHPLPSKENEQATARIMKLLDDCHEDDLVIMLISGGGSTLLCAYDPPMDSAAEQTLFKELTDRGAAIHELNIVRKHLSRARGGGLACAAYPADVIALIASDVPGNDIATISSGPTVRDISTIADAQAILTRSNITLPKDASLIETEKDEKYFAHTTNVLFLTNEDALAAMQHEATQRGYRVEIVNTHYSGEASELGRTIVEKLHGADAKSAFLYAGESTVTIKDPAHAGHGGRSQELALATLETIHPDELVLPFASDGHDNTDSAGAIGDTHTREHAQAHNLAPHDQLAQHCSYDFFKTTGDALQTGYTGSNVSDLIIALKK